MIKIHATKKLLTKLPLDENGMLIGSQTNAGTYSPDDSPIGSWHANLLTLQRQNCVLLIHDATRFPVFLKELRKPDLTELAQHFEHGFMNTLLKAGADDTQMNAAVSCLRPLQFDNDCNRSVQSSSTQRAMDIEHILATENILLSELSTYRMGALLSEELTKIKGMKDYIRPNEAMFALLDKISKISKADIKGADTDVKAPNDGTGNVVSLDKYRR